MATLNDMIDEVRQSLAGFTINQDRISYLSAAIDADDLTLSLGETSNLSKGIVEIDEELMYAVSFNRNAGTLAIAPGFGRGYQGTNPASHSINSQVIINPTFPRNAVTRAINDTIETCGLDAFGTHTFSYSPARITYALPDDAEDIVSVSYSTVGSSKEWMPIRSWRQDRNANVDAFDSTKTISLYTAVDPGRTVQVVYRQDAIPLSNGTDDFEAVSGLDGKARDVIVWGACWRLSAFLDAGRINTTSAESDMADSKIPMTAGTAASRFFFANYQQRLQEEKDRQKRNNPIRIHYTR